MADPKIFNTTGPSKPDINRSVFDLSYNSNLSARFGRIYPVMCKEALPNSTFKIRPSFAFDFMPLVFPIQTNVRCHMSFFKVPFRILWKNYKDYVAQIGDHQMPYIKRSPGWARTGSLADYLGLPSFVDKRVSALSSVGVQHGNVRYFDVFPPVTIADMEHATESYHLYQQGFTNVPLDINGAIPAGTLQTVYFSQHNSIPGNGFGFRTSHFPNGFEWSLDENKQVIVLDFYSDKIVDPDDDDYIGLDLHFSMLVNSCCKRSTTRTTAGQIADYTGVVGDASSAYFLSDSLNTPLSEKGVTVYQSKIAFWVGDLSAVLSEGEQFANSVNLAVNWSDVDGVIFGDANPFHSASTSINTPWNESKEDVEPLRQYNRFGIQPVMYFYNEFDVADDSATTPFDSVAGADPVAPVNALAFRAYEMIYNYHFRNEHVDPFIKNGTETYNEFLTNDGDGADTTTPVTFFNAPYETDLFTTCVKNPQFGNAPLVGVTTNDMEQTFTLHMNTTKDPIIGTTSYKGENTVSLGRLPSTNLIHSTDDFTVSYDHDGNAMALTAYPEDANEQTLSRVRDLVSWGISVNDLRNASALQRFLERRQKAGAQYQNIVKEFFGTTAPVGDEFPEYLGGMTRSIMVNKIQNTSAQGSAPLGEFAGTASLHSGQSDTIEVFCSEQSYIIGLMYFTVTPTYSQQCPKHFLKSHLLDYFNPQFSNIGLQPVYAYQLNALGAYKADTDNPRADGRSHLFDVFGYNRPWSEYVSSQDEVHGLYRKDGMQKFVLQRVFKGVPELGHDFISINSDELTDIFAVTMSTDKIFGLINFDIKAVLPLPRFSIPRIL